MKNKPQYKVLGIDGTDKDFINHDEAFNFCLGLSTHPKGVYKIISSFELGELNMFLGGNTIDSILNGQKLLDIHDKGYERVVI